MILYYENTEFLMIKDLEMEKKMKLGIGNDHAAYNLKLQIKEYLESLGHEVVDYG